MPTTEYFDGIQDEDRAPLKRRIRDIFRFHIGRDRAIKKPELVSILGGVGERKVRMAIDELVDDGALIASDSESGYYTPRDWQEADLAVGELESRGKAILARAGKLKNNAAREFGGQKELF